MPSRSPDAAHSPSRNLSPNPDPAELAALAHSLRDAAQALLVCCGHMPPAGKEAERAMPGGSGVPEVNAEDAGAAGETRSYYFSPSTLRHERELLEKYGARDFRELLDQAHVYLVGLVKLMKSVHADARVKGYVISSLGCLLEQASVLILRMRNLHANVRLVEDGAQCDAFRPSRPAA